MFTEHDAPPGAFAARWLAGLCLATVLAVLLTAPFTDSVMVYARDPAVGALVPAEGHVHHQRAEGWGDSAFGRFGVSGHPDVTNLTGPSVAIWGDSYVEALQVEDGEKVGAQIGAHCPSLGAGEVTGVAIGLSGRSATDVAFLLPRYEKLFRPEAHYIVLPHLSDVLPDGQQFFDDPPRLVSRPLAVGNLDLRRTLERFDLQLFWRAARTVANGADGDRYLRLRPGPVAHDPEKRSGTKYDRPVVLAPDATIEHLFAALATATDRPVVFVYTPLVPLIRANTIRTLDPDADAARHVAALAARHGIGFLNLEERFVAAWRAEGAFPRGFHNGIPGNGHWNALGHRLVALAICSDLASRRGSAEPGAR